MIPPTAIPKPNKQNTPATDLTPRGRGWPPEPEPKTASLPSCPGIHGRPPYLK